MDPRPPDDLNDGMALQIVARAPYALLLTDANVDSVAAVACKVLRVMEPHFIHAGQTMKVGASIGITMYPEDGRHIE